MFSHPGWQDGATFRAMPIQNTKFAVIQTEKPVESVRAQILGGRAKQRYKTTLSAQYRGTEKMQVHPKGIIAKTLFLKS